jgi:hypothetical protein
MERVEVKEQVLEAERLVEVVGGVGERGEAGTGFGESDGVGEGHRHRPTLAH